MKFDDDIKHLKPHIKIAIQMERNAARAKAQKMALERVDGDAGQEDADAEDRSEKAEIFEAIDADDAPALSPRNFDAPRRRGRPKKGRR